jgi:hypothetical protein
MTTDFLPHFVSPWHGNDEKKKEFLNQMKKTSTFGSKHPTARDGEVNIFGFPSSVIIEKKKRNHVNNS